MWNCKAQKWRKESNRLGVKGAGRGTAVTSRRKQTMPLWFFVLALFWCGKSLTAPTGGRRLAKESQPENCDSYDVTCIRTAGQASATPAASARPAPRDTATAVWAVCAGGSGGGRGLVPHALLPPGVQGPAAGAVVAGAEPFGPPGQPGMPRVVHKQKKQTESPSTFIEKSAGKMAEKIGHVWQNWVDFRGK